ncbi:DUF3558 family protein [Corynebacterium belfantii]|uniref:DUF3558 family protein n=2 Tax=Corynebacterium belfantii TaxID=2014537 RepID=UPI0035312BF9
MRFLNKGGNNLMRHLIRGKHAQLHSKPAVLFALLTTLALAGCEGSSPLSSAQGTSTSLSPESAEATFFNPCEVLSAEDFAEMGLVRTEDPVHYERPHNVDCNFLKFGKNSIDGFYMIVSDDLNKERITPNVRFIEGDFKDEVEGSYSYDRQGGLFVIDCEAAIETPYGRLAASASSIIPDRSEKEFCDEANEILAKVYKHLGG